MKLSVIVPCKNEEGNVNGLYDILKDTLKSIKYEVIFIDDGSTDKTLDELKELYEKDMQHVKVLSFSRNFKKEAAMYAGLRSSTGKYTCIIDGDLQQNPNYLLQMIEVLDKEPEYDEVAMVMKERTAENKFMAFCKKSFYKVMNWLSDTKLEHDASDFRMFRENVKKAVLSLCEKNRFSKGIFAWVGFNVKYLPYDVEERKNGKSSFGFKNSLAYAFEGIVSFSQKPLKIATRLGVLTILIDLIYLIVFAICVGVGDAVWTIGHTIILILLLLFGILFLLIGIIGIYLAAMTNEIKNRPVYIVKEKLGFNDETIL